MSDKLKVGQDLSPGSPGDLDIVVVEAANPFVTVQTTKPNALTHEVLGKRGYIYVGPALPIDLVHWHLTYQRYF